MPCGGEVVGRPRVRGLFLPGQVAKVSVQQSAADRAPGSPFAALVEGDLRVRVGAKPKAVKGSDGVGGQWVWCRSWVQLLP